MSHEETQPGRDASAARALRTVIVYTITDAFSLVPQEIDWFSLEVGKVLAPLDGQRPSTVPLSVRQEMTSGTYSREIELKTRKEQYIPLAGQKRVLTAPVDVWADAFMDMVETCFTVSPFDSAQMRTALEQALAKLGIGLAVNGRPALYLPNEMRHRLR